MPLVVEMAGRVGAPEACFDSGHTVARCKGVPETRSEPAPGVPSRQGADAGGQELHTDGYGHNARGQVAALRKLGTRDHQPSPQH